MARLSSMPEPMRSHIAKTKLPVFETQPWITGPPLSQRRVAIISTAGLHRRRPGGDYIHRRPASPR